MAQSSAPIGGDIGEVMAELSDVRQMLEAAERAATAGDLASADELLRNVARIQEAELGPDHPELASTLTNLAIVAEKGGWPGDAEAFYRRAAAIAAASLPPDHPIVTASRQNLEDFCRAGGLRIDPPAVTMPPVEDPDRDRKPNPDFALDTDLALDRDLAAADRRPAAAARSADDPAAATTVRRASAPPPASRSASLPLRWVIIGAVILAAVALFAVRRWSTGVMPAPAPTVTTEPPEATVPRGQASPVAPPPDVAGPPAAESPEPTDPAAPAPVIEAPPVASPPDAAAGAPAPRASASGDRKSVV